MTEKKTCIHGLYSSEYKFTVNLELAADIEERSGDAIRDAIQTDVWKASRVITDRLNMEIDIRNPELIRRREEWLKEAKEVFERAGFSPIYIELIPDGYSNRVYMPWLLITTSRGHFKTGWRSHVILLDWERTNIRADGNELFADQGNITRDKKYIHCWGYEKMISYLKRLKEAE